MNVLIHLGTTFMILICLASAYENESCTNIRTQGLLDYYSRDIYPWDDWYSFWNGWYNTTFWGGYHLIAWQDQIPSHCWNSDSGNTLLVLSEKHPEKLELTEATQSLQGLLLSQTGVVEGNVTVNVRKCNDDILYQLDTPSVWNAYFCFDRIYKHTCDSPTLSLPASKIGNSISVIKLKWSEIKPAWYNSSFDGQFYTLPLLRDVYDVNERCFNNTSEKGLYGKEVKPTVVGESPIGLRVCQINVNDYESYYKDNNDGRYRHFCDYHVFVRSCNGRLMLDLSLLAYLEVDVCLIRTDNVKVVPEIHHLVQTFSHNNTTYNQYNPSLQYRCSFNMEDSYIYKVNWYINGEFRVERGPTKYINNLVLNETDLNTIPLGYEVKCSVIVLQNESDNGTLAVDSETFFAGYKFSDKNITISTQGFTPLTVWKTVPTGCSYNDLSPGICEEPLTLIDTSTRNDRSKRSIPLQHNTCTYGVNSLNAVDHTTFQHTVKTLRAGETWTGTESYKFDIETRDDTYQDSNRRSAQVSQNIRGIVSDNTENEIQMHVIKTSLNEDNKKCYSHVDPHMKTADGRTYEQRQEGDFMLYYHIPTGIQVQERARKCFHHKYPNAVCACAVNIRAGRDLFTINRCQKPYKIKFEQCGDCGNLDVVKMSDFKYQIYTPTSTIISIVLYEAYGGGRNMDINIYLGEKDVKNTEGLCGYFDGDGENDFWSRRGDVLNGNNDHRFSNSWRLSDEENLFKFPKSKLYKLRSATNKCFRHNSITIAKCRDANPKCTGNRQKRTSDGKHLKMIHKILEPQRTFRSKRDTEKNVTVSEAEGICKNTVMGTPAVIEFPDKLANEDLSNVIEQCIFDVTQTNDVSWAEAHKQDLNNLAISILNLNPIYKASNSELVEAFLKKTCVNNCSNNGVCTKEGICSCNDVYRGFDCGVDVRIPPLIEEVTDSGICDAVDATECRCFVIHTNHIFEGYRCEITTFKMFFNGTRYELGKSNNLGEYTDVYTGECCTQVERTNMSDVEEENFIQSYDIAISNDGKHFSDVSSVYVYDATCLLVISEGEINTVELKSGYCFIEDTCVKQGSSHENGVNKKCCNPQSDMFAWTEGECDKDKSDLENATVIGIMIGSLSIVAIVTALLIYLKCCKHSKSRRKIAVENETTHINRIGDLKQPRDVTAAPIDDGLVKSEKGNDPFWSGELPDVPTSGAAKPAYRRNLWNVHEDVEETTDEGRMSASINNRVIVPSLGDLSFCDEPGMEISTSAKFDDGPKSERCLSAVSFQIV